MNEHTDIRDAGFLDPLKSVRQNESGRLRWIARAWVDDLLGRDDDDVWHSARPDRPDSGPRGGGPS